MRGRAEEALRSGSNRVEPCTGAYTAKPEGAPSLRGMMLVRDRRCAGPPDSQPPMLFRIAIVLAASVALGAADRPNIVFVFIDDMGYGDLSCYGNTDIRTINIDRLAEEGVRFEQFYVASPICSPSRVGITTGQFPGAAHDSFVPQFPQAQQGAWHAGFP